MTVVQSPDNVGRNITTDYFTVIWGLFRGGGSEGRAGEAKVLGNEKQRTRPDTLRREMPPNHGQAPPGATERHAAALVPRRRNLPCRQTVLSEKAPRIRSVIAAIQAGFYVAKGHKDQTSDFRWQNYYTSNQTPFRICDKKFRKNDKKILFMSYMSKAGLRETTQTRQGAEEDRRQSKEKPILSSTGRNTPEKGGSCRMRNTPFRIFREGAKYVRAQGGRPAGNGRRSFEFREESSSRKPEIALPRQGSSGALCKAEAGRPDKITD